MSIYFNPATMHPASMGNEIQKYKPSENHPAAINIHEPSFFQTAFRPNSGLLSRLDELNIATRTVPICAICLEKTSSPIALKCGHVFDKTCITKAIKHGNNKCPLDRSPIKLSEASKRDDIYEKTKCKIRVALFNKEGSSLVELEESVFSTYENIAEKITSKFLNKESEGASPEITRMCVRGSFIFYPGKTLADYEVCPGDDTLMWVFAR